MKTLVIDTFKLVKGTGKSIGIYNLTMNLIHRLGEENVKRGLPNKIIILGNEHNRADMECEGTEFELMPGNPLDRKTILLWELFTVNKYSKKYKADRILFPRGFRPLTSPVKDTIIIHDLIPFYYDKHFPGYFNRLENAYIMNRLKASVQHADRVVTISDNSLKEIIEMVPSAKGRVVEIYNGLNEMKDREEIIKSAKDIMEDYFIAVTAEKLPHKNAEGLVKAYARYHALCKEKGETPIELRIVGLSSLDKYIEKGVITAEAAAGIRCIGYVANYQDLCKMIAGAKFFLFMSVAEGFGFPPLEAMQLETAVICSDRTSLPEVVGDAGILVDPDNIDDVAEKILYLQKNDEARKNFEVLGAANTQRFSWDSRTQEYYKELFR